MKSIHFAMIAASLVTVSSAQAQTSSAKGATKAQLARETPPVTSVLPPSPASTGSDNCANAATFDAITGTGLFPMSNLSATDSGIANNCVTVHNDVWFQWTAPSSGLATVSLCNSAAVDTVLAIFSGPGCPVSSSDIICDDDTCGTVSEVVFPCTGGAIYMIDVGSYNATVFYTANISISIGAPPVNDNCATPTVLAGPALYPFDSTLASTGTEGQTEAICNFFTFTAIGNDLWYTYTASTNGTATVTTCGQLAGSPNFDSKIAVYGGAGCPTAGTAIACADDDLTACTQSIRETTVTWPVTCGSVYTLQIGRYINTASIVGNFDLSEVGTTCATPVTYFCFGDGTGLACPCANSGAAGNGCANSLNANGGSLVASGNASVSGDTWTIAGSGIPNGPGLYYQAVNQLGGGNGVVFGDGLRCIGGSVIRLGIVTAAGNASSYPSPNPPAVNAIPISVKGFNLAGDVRNYQLWYRDSTIGFCSASVFNLTNAVNVTWLP